MVDYLKRHEAFILETLAAAGECDWEALARFHSKQLAFMQHERLIHLLVLLAVASFYLVLLVWSWMRPDLPVLLLNGERSPKRYGAMFAAMRQCKPDISAPLIVPNGTHFMNRENPEFFNKAVLDFLTQH